MQCFFEAGNGSIASRLDNTRYIELFRERRLDD